MKIVLERQLTQIRLSHATVNLSPCVLGNTDWEYILQSCSWHCKVELGFASVLSACGVQLVEEKEKRHRRKLNGWNQVFFFFCDRRSLSLTGPPPSPTQRSAEKGNAPQKLQVTPQPQWRPDSSWRPARCVGGRYKRTQTISQTFYGIRHRQKAQNIGHQNKIQYDNWITMETFVSRESMLTTAPLAQTFSLSAASVLVSLSLYPLYLALSYAFILSPPPSLPSVLLNLNQMLHHWRDRKEANVGKEARHYIFLFICQWSFSSFSLSLNRTACDILFKMIYIYIFLNGMKTN